MRLLSSPSFAGGSVRVSDDGADAPAGLGSVRISDEVADHASVAAASGGDSAVAGATAAVSTVVDAAGGDASVAGTTAGASVGWAGIMSVGISVTMVLSDGPASSCADMLR
jgi:hypothetical protein